MSGEAEGQSSGSTIPGMGAYWMCSRNCKKPSLAGAAEGGGRVSHRAHNNLQAIASVVREGNGTPLQYSCLENPMDGGAW